MTSPRRVACGDFGQACLWLDRLGQHRINYDLRRMRRLLRRMGSPERAFDALHITGTNGKGSVAVMLYGALRASGRRAGLYTSPHLVTPRERIVIGDRMIGPEEFADAARAVRRAAARLRETPTYFEAFTAMAFHGFREAGVDAASVEVGLGGRLDATNCLPSPLVSVVTNVSLEHTQYLGQTLASIAREKAGIARRGRPLVTAATQPVVLDALARGCRHRGARLVHVVQPYRVTVLRTDSRVTPDVLSSVGAATPWAGRPSSPPALVGEHQLWNAACAWMAGRLAGLPASAVGQGILAARWPGRLEEGSWRGRRIVLDGAHNLAGVQSLARWLSTHRVLRTLSVTLVFGVMRDKPVAPMLLNLAPVADRLIAVAADDTRALPASRLGRIAAACLPGRPVHLAPSVRLALAEAVRRTPPGGRIVVCGSLYVVGEARAALGWPSPWPARRPTPFAGEDESARRPGRTSPARDVRSGDRGGRGGEEGAGGY